MNVPLSPFLNTDPRTVFVSEEKASGTGLSARTCAQSKSHAKARESLMMIFSFGRANDILEMGKEH